MHADTCPPDSFSPTSCACGFVARFIGEPRPEAARIPSTYIADVVATLVSCPCFFCDGPAHPSTGCQYSERVIACHGCTVAFWAWAKGHFATRGRPGRDKRGRVHADFYAAAARNNPSL